MDHQEFNLNTFPIEEEGEREVTLLDKTLLNYYKRNNYRYSHCEPEGRGNLDFTWDCFVVPLLAVTRYLNRLY